MKTSQYCESLADPVIVKDVVPVFLTHTSISAIPLEEEACASPMIVMLDS